MLIGSSASARASVLEVGEEGMAACWFTTETMQRSYTKSKQKGLGENRKSQAKKGHRQSTTQSLIQKSNPRVRRASLPRTQHWRPFQMANRKLSNGANRNYTKIVVHPAKMHNCKYEKKLTTEVVTIILILTP